MNFELISGEVCEKELFDGNLEGTPKACGLETVKWDPVLKWDRIVSVISLAS